MLLSGLLMGGSIGLLLGLTGAGGGILAVPALVVGMGFTLTEAKPIALIAIGLAAFLGCMDGWRQGLVRYRAALWMAAVGLLVTPIGSSLSQWMPERVGGILFSGLMAFSALRLIRSLRFKQSSTSPLSNDMTGDCLLDANTGRLRWTPRCVRSLLQVGAYAGFLTGLFGVGGGFVIVPGLRRVSDLDMRSGVATSLMVIATISIFSALAMMVHGASVPVSGLWFAGAAGVGTLFGRWLSRYVALRALQCIFAAVTILAACVMLLKSI
ncbi:sulfite exporter TauE/SafE family protein [Herminiimonas contaminans]|uniref:Probable membrane transporter protein n=1 Tax=Herminiimonas contaminans TaxID=1111140 RepID=A0ABS0EWN5_9BURK|nr:sulfite exporter TauE/SafE family protein [Herminiimonas contaminans]MBF8179258.1 sulfite exporter TauE/SafE family protein [Herminiimonas contaminans]